MPRGETVEIRHCREPSRYWADWASAKPSSPLVRLTLTRGATEGPGLRLREQKANERIDDEKANIRIYDRGGLPPTVVINPNVRFFHRLSFHSLFVHATEPGCLVAPRVRVRRTRGELGLALANLPNISKVPSAMADFCQIHRTAPR